MLRTLLFLTGPAGDPFAATGTRAADLLAQACPTATGYTQTRTIEQQLDRTSTPDYVGVVELWFSDVESAQTLHQSPEHLRPLVTDTVSFDFALTGHERVVMRQPQHLTEPTQIKGVFPFRRKPGMAVDDFQRYWWNNHGPIAALTERALCYTQLHPVPEMYATAKPPFDGVTELHWLNAEDAAASMASEQMQRDQSGDSKNFVEPKSVRLFLARDELVK